MKPNIKNKNTICIYCIENTINNKKYIGKTSCLYKRMYQYLYSIKNPERKCINEYFLNAFKKYGLENFRYYIIENFEELNDDLLKERELFWINYYSTTNSDKGYNLRRDSSTNMIIHEKTRKKISKRLKKEWKNGVRKNHSKKLKESWKNRDNEKQAKLFRKTLTKYCYYVYKNNNLIGKVFYKDLVKMNLRNVVGKFSEKNKDCVDFKGYKIKRIRIEDIVRTSKKFEKQK